MSLTLNQIVKRLQTLAEEHKQINTFGFGPPLMFDERKDTRYPACVLNLVSTSIDRNQKQTRYNLDLYFYDLGDATSETMDEAEIMSDLTLIAEDFAALVNYSGYRDWQADKVFSLEYFKDKLTDWTYCVRMRMTIGVDFLSDRCRVPSTTTNETGGFDYTIPLILS